MVYIVYIHYTSGRLSLIKSFKHKGLQAFFQTGTTAGMVIGG